MLQLRYGRLQGCCQIGLGVRLGSRVPDSACGGWLEGNVVGGSSLAGGHLHQVQLLQLAMCYDFVKCTVVQ